jgi:hypothetical protein
MRSTIEISEEVRAFRIEEYAADLG